MDNEELILKLAKMDEEAEKRADERDKQYQLAEERRKKERMHEEHQTQQMMMLSNFMSHKSSAMMPQQYPMCSPYGYGPSDYTVHPSPSSSHSSNQYESDGNNPNIHTSK